MAQEAPGSIINLKLVRILAMVCGALSEADAIGLIHRDVKPAMEVCGQHLHQEPTTLSARGLAIPAELEAVVLACLNKHPNRRPQSALEPRRRVEACPVESWDDDKALAWWREYEPDLDGLARQSTGDVRTIAVDGARRGLGGTDRFN
jgi:hypothetical protein